MKYFLLFILSGFFMLPVKSLNTYPLKPHVHNAVAPKAKTKAEGSKIILQDIPGSVGITAIEFKSQKYCRAELEDCDFDVHFSIVTATVYFSGTNFNHIVKTSIAGNKLDQIRSLIDRCAPGTIVVFDDIKVNGTDNTTRILQPVSYLLR